MIVVGGTSIELLSFQRCLRRRWLHAPVVARSVLLRALGYGLRAISNLRIVVSGHVADFGMGFELFAKILTRSMTSTIYLFVNALRAGHLCIQNSGLKRALKVRLRHLLQRITILKHLFVIRLDTEPFIK